MLCRVCYTVIDNIEIIKKIVTISGLRWKIISKPTSSECEPVNDRDVSKRLIHIVYFRCFFI